MPGLWLLDTTRQVAFGAALLRFASEGSVTCGFTCLSSPCLFCVTSLILLLPLVGHVIVTSRHFFKPVVILKNETKLCSFLFSLVLTCYLIDRVLIKSLGTDRYFLPPLSWHFYNYTNWPKGVLHCLAMCHK